MATTATTAPKVGACRCGRPIARIIGSDTYSHTDGARASTCDDALWLADRTAAGYAAKGGRWAELADWPVVAYYGRC